MLAELRALIERATEGPWYAQYQPFSDSIGIYGAHHLFVATTGSRDHEPNQDEIGADAELIVAAVNALPLLLDIAEKAGQS